MIKAAAERVTKQYASPDYEPPSYCCDHRYSLNSQFDGDATTSRSLIAVRTKRSFSPSRDRKRRRVDKPASTDLIPPLPERNPSNTDWNSRRRSDTSGPNSFTSHSYASSQRHAADPPRPAKEGMEWVWFPEGYWAERAKVDIGQRRDDSTRRGESPKKWFNRSPSPGRRKSSSIAQKVPELIANFTDSLDIPKFGDTHRTESNTSGMSKVSDAESRLEKLRMGFNYMSPTYPHFVSPTGEPEGLYCKTKRNVEVRLVPRRRVVCFPLPFSYF